MHPTDFQSKVLNSNKRITIVTAQPGAGTTTALLMKLADEASKSKNNLCIFCTRTDLQARWAGTTFAKYLSKARYSSKSSILSFEYEGEKVKIKLMGVENLSDDKYITCVAFDNHINKDSVQKALLIAGKVLIADRLSYIAMTDSWAYALGFLSKDNNRPWEKPEWIKSVEVIKGYTELNPHLAQDYKDFLYNCNPNYLKEMMTVEF